MNNSSEQISYIKVLWDQYSIFIELYKFYLTTIIKMNIFYYAITGAILSFYFIHSSVQYLIFSLFLPIIFSIGLIIVFLRSIPKIIKMDKTVSQIAGGLKLDTYPEMLTLKYIVILFPILHIFVVCFLLFLFANKIFCFFPTLG